MQVYEFQEADRKRLVFVFGLAVVVAIGVPMVAFGIDRMAELVNSSSTKWVAVVAVVWMLACFFVLKKLIGTERTASLSQDNGVVRLSRAGSVVATTPVDSIAMLARKDLTIPLLDVCLRDGQTFYTFQPSTLNNVERLEQIEKIVAFFRGFSSLDPTDVSRKGKTGTCKVVEFRVKGPAA